MIATLARPTLDLKVYRTQAEFVADERRYVAFIGGRNSGKTFSGSVKAITKAARGGLGFIGAPSFPMLEHGAKRQFIERLDETGELYTLTRSGVVIPRWNAEVIFVTLENEGRIRGPNFAWGWVDEVEYMSDPLVWKATKGAVREGDAPQLFVTSTPKGRRLVYQEWVVNGTEHHALYRATTWDNVFIDAADYVAGLGYEGVFAQQEIGAEFVAFEGLVYPGFDRERCVQSVETNGWRRALGMDVGSRNPTAILTFAFGSDRTHQERELYRRGMSSDDMVDEAVTEYHRAGAEWIAVDPSAASIIKSLQARGLNVVKANNEVKTGISRVTSMLSTFTIDPSCVNTIDEYESYRYADSAAVEKDAVVKAQDHAMDATRYFAMTRVTHNLTGSLMV